MQMSLCRSRTVYLLLVIATLALSGAAYPSISTPTARVIPVRIIESGRKYLIERVGKDFFERYITLDSSWSYFSPRDVAAGHPSVRSAARSGDTAAAAPAPSSPRRLGGETPLWMLTCHLRV